MKVMHCYCLNYNIGDYALGIGVKNIFRDVYNVSFIAECNLQGQVFDDYFIDIINEKYDLLVIGGGGIIHGAHWPNGWFWLIDKERIKKLKIPFIVYGVGYNYFKDEEGIPERGVVHLKETYKRAAFFSVRNDGSYERLLDGAGIDANVVADPGFWVPLNREYDEFSTLEKYIVVQLADDKSLHRFKTAENRMSFVNGLTSVLQKYSSKYKIIFAPHVFDDIQLSEEISRYVDNSSVLDFGKYAFDRSAEFLSIYKNAEFVLGMRGHGQIVPLGFNVPVISLENHDKHKGLMDRFGLGFYNVDVTDKDFALKLDERIERIENERDDIVNHISKKNLYLFDEATSKMKNIDQLKQFVR